MTRSLTVISLLLQPTTHCRYRVYTKFLLTYTAIYRGNRIVLPLGITALQLQSHFHLGTPYKFLVHHRQKIVRLTKYESVPKRPQEVLQRLVRKMECKVENERFERSVTDLRLILFVFQCVLRNFNEFFKFNFKIF